MPVLDAVCLAPLLVAVLIAAVPTVEGVSFGKQEGHETKLASAREMEKVEGKRLLFFPDPFEKSAAPHTICSMCTQTTPTPKCDSPSCQKHGTAVYTLVVLQTVCNACKHSRGSACAANTGVCTVCKH